MLDRKGAMVLDAQGQPAERPIRQTALSGALIGKGNHRHFMEKEISRAAGGARRHAALVRRPGHAPDRPAASCRSTSPTVPRIAAVACGTASYAGLVGKYWFESWPACRSTGTSRREFRYRDAPLVAGQVGPVRLASRARPPTRWRRMRHLRAAGQQGAGGGQRAGEHAWRARPTALLRTLAGPEIGVASTKAFTDPAGGARLPRRSAPPGRAAG